MKVVSRSPEGGTYRIIHGSPNGAILFLLKATRRKQIFCTVFKLLSFLLILVYLSVAVRVSNLSSLPSFSLTLAFFSGKTSEGLDVFPVQ
jgi:hypothetical protein